MKKNFKKLWHKGAYPVRLDFTFGNAGGACHFKPIGLTWHFLAV
jgi:hypothetical protein